MTSLIENVKTYLLKVRWNHFYRNYRLPEISLDSLGVPYKAFKPTIMEEICIPPYLGDDNLDDYALLFSLLDHFKPKTLLELGTAQGNTVANICAQFETSVVTVNALPEQIAGRVITYCLTREEIGSVYKKNGFSKRVTQVFEDTKKMDLAKYVATRSIDFAIIDACHDSDFVVNDFLKVEPFMALGSVVIFHDTHPSLKKHYIDSYIGCMYLRKLGHSIKYLKGSSWGIWFANEGGVQVSLTRRLVDRVERFFDSKIFGSQIDDLMRIRRYAKRFAGR